MNKNNLTLSKRGSDNEPRNIAMYLMRMLSGIPLLEIGSTFKLNRHSSVSSAIERVNAKLKKSRSFRKKRDELIKLINKGQT